MAKTTKVTLNIAGVRALRKSPEMEAVLKAQAERFAGDGWQTDTKEMGTRIIASVYTTDSNAVEEELKTHALVGRISSAGG